MVNFFGISITVLLVWAICRKMYLNYVSLKFTHKVFEARDKLRLLAIEGGLDKNSWVFEYYDSSFSNTIKDHYYLTMFRLIGTAVKTSGDEELEEFSIKLESELKKNEELAHVVDDFRSAAARYVINQHYISVGLIIIPILSPFIGVNNLMRSVGKWSEKTLRTPDLSQSGKYLNSI